MMATTLRDLEIRTATIKQVITSMSLGVVTNSFGLGHMGPSKKVLSEFYCSCASREVRLSRLVCRRFSETECAVSLRAVEKLDQGQKSEGSSCNPDD